MPLANCGARLVFQKATTTAFNGVALWPAVCGVRPFPDLAMCRSTWSLTALLA